MPKEMAFLLTSEGRQERGIQRAGGGEGLGRAHPGEGLGQGWPIQGRAWDSDGPSRGGPGAGMAPRR